MARPRKKKEKTPEPTHNHTEVIQAQHKFSEKEKITIAEEMCREIQKLGELESSLKHVQSDFKSKMKGSQSRIDELSNKINSGYEFRPTECRVEFAPKDGSKKYFRIDDNEFVRSDAMTPADFQMTLPVETKNGKKEEPLNPVLNDEEAKKLEKTIDE